MRLLLDAHISARRIAVPLRRRGHDVHAAGEDPALARCPDERLLALAARERRILVTFDVNDFPNIARSWAEGQRSHAGCLILVGIYHGEYGVILRALERAFAARPKPKDWRDLAAFVGRAP